MNEISAIFIFLLIGIIIVAVLFYVVKWIFRKQIDTAIKETKNRVVGKAEIVVAVLTIVGLGVLTWFQHNGNKSAAFIWGLIVFSGCVGAYFLKKKK